MNGAVFDSTFNVFFKLRYQRLYDAMLATPVGPRDIAVGEITWSLMRGALYSALFLVVALAAGMVHSWWALLALPAAIAHRPRLRGGRHVRDDLHDELAALRLRHPRGPADVPVLRDVLPLSTYPEALQWVVRATPLYQGVALERGLMLGEVGWSLLGNAAYLVALGVVGIIGASRRIERLLLT